jgi:glutathione S-transferase
MASDATTSATTTTTGLVLYDIAYAPPYEQNASAPNPWKARYALNFKDVPYSTQWVQMPDIAKVRQDLGVPAGRKFADGTDFYTLPILIDSSSGTKLGDSFDIATYLQNNFPDSGAGNLFPPQELDYVCPGTSFVPLSERNDDAHAHYAQFNSNVDMAFSMHAQLMAHGMKWDPKYEEQIKAEFVRRAAPYGITSWEAMGLKGEARDKMKASLREALGGLAVLFQRDGTGPFKLGNQPSYADIIVGGWLRMLSKTLETEEWEEVQGWYDGVFRRLHAALQERFGDVK